MLEAQFGICYQWRANREGGQRFGNQMRVEPLSRETYREFFKDDKLGYDELKRRGAWLRLVRKHGKGWELDRVSDKSQVVPDDESAQRWALVVKDFDSEEARAFGKVADSDVKV